MSGTMRPLAGQSNLIAAIFMHPDQPKPIQLTNTSPSSKNALWVRTNIHNQFDGLVSLYDYGPTLAMTLTKGDAPGAGVMAVTWSAHETQRFITLELGNQKRVFLSPSGKNAIQPVLLNHPASPLVLGAYTDGHPTPAQIWLFPAN